MLVVLIADIILNRAKCCKDLKNIMEKAKNLYGNQKEISNGFKEIVDAQTNSLGLLIGSPIAERVGVNIWFLISGTGTTVITVIGLLLHQEITLK